MSVYVVTGAAGFIGSHLVEKLLARGDRVIGVDWLTYAGSVASLDFVPERDRVVFLPLFGSLPRRHALYAHYAEEGPHRLAEFAMEAKEARDLSVKISPSWTVRPVPTREDRFESIPSFWSGLGQGTRRNRAETAPERPPAGVVRAKRMTRKNNGAP